MPSYRYGPRPAAVTSELRSGVTPAEPVEPPAKQSKKDLQAVLDDAHEQGILEEPTDAAEAQDQGVTAARIDEVGGETVLVERVEPKPRSRKAKR